MEKRELIERHRDPADNRYMQVSITGIGRELIDGMFAAHVAGIVLEMRILTIAEQEELGRLCRKLGLRKE
jgi:MarR family 2-MHQ and catechol resistance regulon transcriptional repressor